MKGARPFHGRAVFGSGQVKVRVAAAIKNVK